MIRGGMTTSRTDLDGEDARAGAPDRRQPGRLGRDVIVDACIALADREGAEAVTLRRLGGDLGADATAVYRHFRSKSELLGAVADRLLARVLDGFEPTGAWRHDVHDVIVRARRVSLVHPALAPVLAAAPAPLPSVQRIAEVLFDALRLGGLGDRHIALAYQLLESYTAGAASLDARAAADEVNSAWRVSFAMLPADRFPNAVAVAPHLYRDDDDAFEFGLEMILDALEALAAPWVPPMVGTGGTG
jgi:AcrR family transcriptional regulator